jgi:methylated-DNA-protein-cysteine methyltransferase-like protein
MKNSRQSSNSYEVIWETVRQIPKGKVATYGEIADVNGLTGQARLVGYALHNLPHNSGIPWHRVINAQGRISFPKGSRSHTTQRKLLEKEGIVFRGEKIDFGKYRWLRQIKKKHTVI